MLDPLRAAERQANQNHPVAIFDSGDFSARSAASLPFLDGFSNPNVMAKF